MLRILSRVGLFCSLIMLCTGCDKENYFSNEEPAEKESFLDDINSVIDKINKEIRETERHLLPNSIYDYDVTDTPLVPKKR